MTDPLDKLIGELQGKPEREPIILPIGAQLALPVIDGNSSQFFALGIPDLSEPNRLVLWYREIIRHYSDSAKPPGDALSPWKQYKITITSSSKLSLLEPKQRENTVITLALNQEIGRYPKVLYAFEWFDRRLGKPLRQEIKDGFVRGN